MSTVKLELQLSSEELLKAVEQLNQPDLEKFVSQVIILHTQRKSAKLLKDEAESLLKNNQDVSCDAHSYYNQLLAKADEENLTYQEYRELLRLSEQIDKLQAHRFEYLADLANLHGVSLMELMKSLGFQM
ncbi:STAS/SEC14 domain-containing protein [Anabaena sphaerica FACHB-251]|uniref:STAS/SEC14 domain-containing protein n=1 Tax=Anabaena sphaerica FACHB-251 TaxID=2692883 RepID=A0A926WIN9_9NOST|nr:STAS/SEC14 domain-containing protein [Anabaena sphaerica]MBD2294850.1 STAS/SEC14 domain-containing protein [Anabaena sphaerica FACHB-251]